MLTNSTGYQQMQKCTPKKNYVKVEGWICVPHNMLGQKAPSFISYNFIVLWAQNCEIWNMRLAFAEMSFGNQGGCNLWERETYHIGAWQACYSAKLFSLCSDNTF